ncbi:MAG: HD domain-containing protein [Patescibacteria group bacterium]
MKRVEENALKIKKLLNNNDIDDKILRLACAWHDISYVFFKASPRQYFLEARRSVRFIKKNFKEVNFPEDELKIITNIVLYHDVLMSFRRRNEKRSLHNKIMQDTDFLDGTSNDRIDHAKKLSKNSMYWKFVSKILVPIFIGTVVKNKNKFLNLEENTRL